MSTQLAYPQALYPDGFMVEVVSEMGSETIQRRWREVNVLLRLSMLTGVPMQLDAALSMLADFAAEIVDYDSALFYFWEESSEQMLLRAARGMDRAPEGMGRGNIFDLWASRFGRPLLITKGKHAQADVALAEVSAQSALVIPLVTSHHTLGSMQFFSSNAAGFTEEDAHLLWVLTLVAESMLNRQQANEGLLTFAFTDYLTGLKTRGYFEQQLDLELKRCERKQEGLALLMLDIDYFKPLNDRYGHHVGDQVLRDVAALLTKDMREMDTVARYGGEEFVIVLPETNAFAATRVADRIRGSVDQAKFFAGSPEIVEHLTISIGIAVYPQDARFKADLITSADAALYNAKSRGRNQVTMYSELALQQRREVG
jgi:diguanylate cyclase (GGDEF)-like protein